MVFFIELIITINGLGVPFNVAKIIRVNTLHHVELFISEISSLVNLELSLRLIICFEFVDDGLVLRVDLHALHQLLCRPVVFVEGTSESHELSLVGIGKICCVARH